MDSARIAVLIDADNSPAAKIDAILSQAATLGAVNVRRAYGNWVKDELKGWRQRLHESAITPIQQFDLTQGKNASDIAMVIDAMDLLHGGDVDGFAIVSSDSDFTPLVTRLRQSGAVVVGFGRQRSPMAFRNACTRFYELESLDDAADSEVGTNDSVGDSGQAVPVAGDGSKRVDGSTLKGNTRLIQMLRSAIDETAEDDDWAPLGRVGSVIRNQSSFEPRNYGYAKFSSLVQAIDLFETKLVDKAMYVRRAELKKTARKAQPSKATVPGAGRKTAAAKPAAKPAAKKVVG